MKFNRIIILCALTVALSNTIFSQVGIGTTTPDASAELDVTSSTKGLLPPRMTQTQRNAIVSAAAGLIVWCTNCGTAGELQVFNGTTWTNVIGGAASTTSISSITCGSSTSNGTLTSGTVASGVSSYVPYAGGNGGAHSGQTVTSTGVTGLTATLSAGTFAVGSGSLTYTMTGTPSTSGTATFALNIGGQTCNLIRTVNVAFLCGTSTVTFTYNGASVTYGTVSSAGSKCWLDRNLGATQVATSSTDANSYGDLFQWGRGSDGHQITTSNQITGQSTSTSPGSSFLVGSSNWYSGTNPDLLWQGVSGINNPCPSGYRLPTDPELVAEYSTWSSSGAAGAFGSPLKLPVGGARNNAGGSLYDIGSIGYYWSSAVSGALSSYVIFNGSGTYLFGNSRANGQAVRCIMD